MSAELRIETRTGTAIKPRLPAIARLRVAVFREWPYLYDGDATYEERYLRVYADSPRAGVAMAFDGETAVGASTCLPLAEASTDIAAPFRVRGWRVEDFFYFGESVLLPAYRGRGAGVAFFQAREDHARRFSSCAYACFCSVIRPDDHPARPAGHQPLDAFWRKRGYTPYPDLTCLMSWRDAGDAVETPKALRFWIKPLARAALP